MPVFLVDQVSRRVARTAEIDQLDGWIRCERGVDFVGLGAEAVGSV